MSRPPTESTSRASAKQTEKTTLKSARSKVGGKASSAHAGKRSTVAARRSVRSDTNGLPLGDLTRPIARDRRLLRSGLTRWLVPVTAIGLVVVFAFALFVRPVQTYFDQNRKLDERTAQFNQMLTVIGQLRAEVERLKTADGVKEAARDQLGYINAGEERVTVNIDGQVPTELPPGWPYNLATSIMATRAEPQAGVVATTNTTISVPPGSAPVVQPPTAPAAPVPAQPAPATAVSTP